MKQLKNSRISTIVLWICMMVSLGIILVYYSGLVKHPDSMDTAETSALLVWLFVLLGICLSAVLFFSIFQLFKQWKTNKRSVGLSLIGVSALGFLLFICYFLGSGQILEITDYDGKDNVYPWLKITDMWIYSIVVLLVSTFLAVILGIIWSYIKKTR